MVTAVDLIEKMRAVDRGEISSSRRMIAHAGDLASGGVLEHAQAMAAPYDRTKERLTRDQVARVGLMRSTQWRR